MKRLVLLPLLALAAAPCLAQDPATSAPAADDTFVSRAYVLPYASGCCWTTKETSEEEDSSEGWQHFFSVLGVEWPEGSSISHSPHLDCWIVRNTRANHARIREALRPIYCPGLQIRVQLHFCAFTPEAFESLNLSETVGTMLDPAAWKTLRKRILETEGAEIRGCPAVLVQRDAPATVKTNIEYIFPTEFDVEMLESAATASDTNAPAHFVSAAVEPRNFQCREVGQVFQVTPRVSQDSSRISLDLTPTLVLPPVWRNYGSPVLGGAADPTEPKMEQPFFPVSALATALDLKSGATAALGGCALDEPGRGSRFHVFFVTASLVETDPDLVPPYTPTAP